MKGQAWLLTQLYLLEKSTCLLHENASPMFMVCVLLWIQKNNTYLTVWISLAKIIISEILFPKLFEAQYIVIPSFGSKIFKPIKMCYKTINKKTRHRLEYLHIIFLSTFSFKASVQLTNSRLCCYCFIWESLFLLQFWRIIMLDTAF